MSRNRTRHASTKLSYCTYVCCRAKATVLACQFQASSYAFTEDVRTCTVSQVALVVKQFTRIPSVGEGVSHNKGPCPISGKFI